MVKVRCSFSTVVVLTAKIIYYLCQYMFMKYKILKFSNLFGGKKIKHFTDWSISNFIWHDAVETHNVQNSDVNVHLLCYIYNNSNMFYAFFNKKWFGDSLYRESVHFLEKRTNKIKTFYTFILLCLFIIVCFKYLLLFNACIF